MVAKDHESDLPNLANYNDTYEYYISNNNKDQDEEEEDTLSLCDLSSYDDSFKWDDDYSSIENDNNEDFFEFFSDDYFTSDSTNPTNTNKTDNIVFCGKIIPYRGQHDIAHTPQVSQRRKTVTVNKKKPSNDNNEPVGAMMIKPRWYFYVFGMVKFFPAEYKLRDMRTRQRRRRRTRSQSSMSFASSDDNNACETTKEKKVSFSRTIKRSGAKGLWGLIRALRFGSQRL